MKNKGLTIFLLIAVAFIWGLLIYKLYYSINGNKTTKFRTAAVHEKKVSAIIASYTLHEYSKDPFLSILTDTMEPRTVVPQKQLTPAIKKVIVLPQYFGLIQNSKKKTAIFQIDKKTFFVHEGEIFQALKIKAIKPDSVIVWNDGNKITIPLKKKRERNVR